jgi:hypothetical protein
VRIKSHWHKTDIPKSWDEHAGALSSISWRIALEAAKNMHKEGYVYDSDVQRVAVIAEFLAFLIQTADRFAHTRMSDLERADFINRLAQRTTNHMEDNLTDLFGPGNYREPFIERLNERLSMYADFPFSEDGEPGYAARRFLGGQIQAAMGPAHENKWAIDQAMDIEAPKAVKLLMKAMLDLLG